MPRGVLDSTLLLSPLLPAPLSLRNLTFTEGRSRSEAESDKKFILRSHSNHSPSRDPATSRAYDLGGIRGMARREMLIPFTFVALGPYLTYELCANKALQSKRMSEGS